MLHLLTKIKDRIRVQLLVRLLSDKEFEAVLMTHKNKGRAIVGVIGSTYKGNYSVCY